MGDPTSQSVLNAQWNAAAIQFGVSEALLRPSVLYKPSLCREKDGWCAFLTHGLADNEVGMAGRGSSPEKAMEDFDKKWVKDV